MENILNKYNDLCELTQTGWWSINLKSKKITLDSFLQRILSLDESEMPLDKFIKLIVPDEQHAFRMALKLLAYNKTNLNSQLHFRSGLGSFGADFLLNKTSIDDEGYVYEASGIIKVCPETRDFSGSLLNLILQYIPMFFFIKDVENDSKYVYCSPMMKTLFRFHRENPIGRTDFELFGNPEIAYFFHTKDLEVYQTGQPQHYCEEVIDAEGNRRVMDTIKVLMKRENRPPYILGLSWDLTYQKKIESLLYESNMRVHMACKAGSIYPWTWDMDKKTGEITFVDENKVVTKSVTHESFLADIHPDDLAVFTKKMRDFIDSDEINLKFEMRCRCFSDKYEWYELIGNVYDQDKHNNRSRVVGILRNITEYKRHEEILQESDRMKSAFLASMSHEIRTPLNAIIGFSSLLAQTEDDEQKSEFLRIIEKNNDLLLRLINDMLDIAKFESGRPDFSFGEFAMNDIFISNEQTYSKLTNPEVNVIFERNEDDYIINGDKTRISQVLSNLLSNAQKFTKKGYIRFGYKPTDNGIFVYVNDSGCGIPSHLQPYIFDRFMKADSYSQGLGLGLFISKTIVSLLKGEIGVRSEEENGSIFWFKIPCSVRAISKIEELMETAV